MPLFSLPCRHQTPNAKFNRALPPTVGEWQIKQAALWLKQMDTWIRRTVPCRPVLPADMLAGDASRAQDKKERHLCDALRLLFETEGVVICLRSSVSLLLLHAPREHSEKLRRIQAKVLNAEQHRDQQHAALLEDLADAHDLVFKSAMLTKVKEQLSKYYALASSLGDELHYLALEGWPSDHILMEHLKDEISSLWRRSAAYEELYLRILKAGEECAVVSDVHLAEMKQLLQEYDLEISDFNNELTELLRDQCLTEAHPSVRRLQHLIRSRVMEKCKVLRLYLHLLKSGGIQLSVSSRLADLQQAIKNVRREMLSISNELTCLLLDHCPSYDEFVCHLKFTLEYLTKEEHTLQAALQDIAKSQGRRYMHREKLLAEFSWLMETHDQQSLVLDNHLTSMLLHGCLQRDETYHEVMEDLAAQRQASKLQYLQLLVEILRGGNAALLPHDVQFAGLQQQLSNYEALIMSVRDEMNVLILAGNLPPNDPYIQHVQTQVQHLHHEKIKYMNSCLDLYQRSKSPLSSSSGSGSMASVDWNGSVASFY